MFKFWHYKEYRTYVEIRLLGIRVKLKKSYSAADLLYKKVLFWLPEYVKLGICGLFDASYKWQWNMRYKKFSYRDIFALLDSYKIFPKNILSIDQTIQYILDNKCSVARIGDGEELLFNMVEENPAFPKLKQELLDICQKGTNSKCLVCFNNFNADSQEVPEIYRQHFAYYYTHIVTAEKLSKISFNAKSFYGDAYAFLFYVDNAATPKEQKRRKEKIKELWNGRKVCFVINRFSPILEDKECFDNVLEKKYIFVPQANAYAAKDSVLAELKELDKTWLIYLACGALATTLSFELSAKGYQALDMGGYYDRIYKQDHSGK